MAQTGTGKARDKLVLRARVEEFITVDVWWKDDDPGFPAPALTEPPAVPASFVIPRQGPTFPTGRTAEGIESRSGSWNLIGAVQRGRPGVDTQMAVIEAEIRSLAAAGHADADTEDVWTPGPIETHEDVAPGNLPDGYQKAFRFDEFVIQYTATEIGR